MDNVVFMIVVYVLIIALLIALIVMSIKGIFMIDKVNKSLDDINYKLHSLNGAFAIVDKVGTFTNNIFSKLNLKKFFHWQDK